MPAWRKFAVFSLQFSAADLHLLFNRCGLNLLLLFFIFELHLLFTVQIASAATVLNSFHRNPNKQPQMRLFIREDFLDSSKNQYGFCVFFQKNALFFFESKRKCVAITRAQVLPKTKQQKRKKEVQKKKKNDSLNHFYKIISISSSSASSL
ncbi:hypothetical protein [Methanolapillus millepedarum]|uniref:hypothetical protein n=1 Tax=Methanolapillus millepedarum TaxID=3028296 RepID=UPI0030B8E99D